MESSTEQRKAPAGLVIGRVVVYRSRTGNYDVPAIVTATVDTLVDVGVKMYEESEGQQGVPPLTDENHVHLHVLTPGIPGQRAEAQDFKSEGVRRAENIGGAYQEWDVGEATSQESPEPGSWRWPVRVEA